MSDPDCKKCDNCGARLRNGTTSRFCRNCIVEAMVNGSTLSLFHRIRSDEGLERTQKELPPSLLQDAFPDSETREVTTDPHRASYEPSYALSPQPHLNKPLFDPSRLAYPTRIRDLLENERIDIDSQIDALAREHIAKCEQICPECNGKGHKRLFIRGADQSGLVLKEIKDCRACFNGRVVKFDLDGVVRDFLAKNELVWSSLCADCKNGFVSDSPDLWDLSTLSDPKWKACSCLKKKVGDF